MTVEIKPGQVGIFCYSEIYGIAENGKIITQYHNGEILPKSALPFRS